MTVYVDNPNIAASVPVVPCQLTERRRPLAVFAISGSPVPLSEDPQELTALSLSQSPRRMVVRSVRALLRHPQGIPLHVAIRRAAI